MESQNVRRAPGPDRVSNWIKNQLARKSYSIIESSLKKSSVPLDQNRANIVLIHTGGDRQKTFYYRPVSLTSIVAKIRAKNYGQMVEVLGREKHTHGWSVWIQRRKVLYNELTKLLLKYLMGHRKKKGRLIVSTWTSRRLLTRYVTRDCSGEF